MLPNFGLLGDVDFRKLYVSSLITAVGTQVSRFALPMVAVVSLQASEFEVGVMTALTGAALVIFGLPAGVWIDQHRRRGVLIASDVVRAIALATIPAASAIGYLRINQLYVIAFVVGICSLFFEAASQSYLPSLVGRPNLIEANSKLEGIRQVFGLGGPAGAGQIVALVGAPLALIVTSSGVAASSLAIVAIRKAEPDPKPRVTNRAMRHGIVEGLRFVLGERVMRSMVICTNWINLCTSAYSTMIMVFLARDLNLTASTIGIVMTLSGVGGIAGAMTARRLSDYFGQGPTMWAVLLIGMPFFIVLPLVGPDWRIWLAGAAGAVPIYSVVVYSVVHVSARTSMTPDELLGRMNSTMRFLSCSAMPVGSLIGGGLGIWLGARGALLTAAVAACLSFLPLFLSPLRKMRIIRPTQSVGVQA